MADNKVDLNSGEVDAGDNKPNKESMDLDQFFSGLEKSFNGAIYDEEGDNTPKPDDGDAVEPDDNSDDQVADTDLSKELDNLKSRYESSSNEAKRLASKLQRYEDVEDLLPVVDVMKRDPNLLRQVRSYLEEGVSPQAVVKTLGLDEDFVFDPDEAIKDPSSDSSKVFNKLIEAGVDRRLSAEEAKRSAKERADSARKSEFDAFREKHEIDEGKFEEFVEWAKSTPMTLDHLWALKNGNNRDNKILKKSIEDREKQLDKMSNTPRSLANQNSPGGADASPDEEVFMGILNSLGQGLFGGIDNN